MVNYPCARVHPRCEVSCQGVLHRRFVRAFSRPARQWRKLCHATKLTDSQPRCQVFAVFSRHLQYTFFMLRTRPRTGMCEHLMPDVMASKVHQNNRSYVSSQRTYLRIHYVIIQHGGRLHGEPQKTTKLSKLGVGACSGMGTCSGQYGRSTSGIRCSQNMRHALTMNSQKPLLDISVNMKYFHAHNKPSKIAGEHR